MSVLLTHLIMAAFSIPALIWLRRDVRLALHRPGRWLPLVCLSAHLSLLAFRLFFPVRADIDPLVALLSGACLLGREYATHRHQRGRPERAFSLVPAGLLGILTVSGAWDWPFLNTLAALMCAPVCVLLVIVLRAKTAGRDSVPRKFAQAWPWFWLLVEATAWLGPEIFRHIARLHGLVFLVGRVFLSTRQARARQVFSIRGLAALQRGSYHQFRNAFSGIAELVRFAQNSPEDADRRRCLGLVQEYSQDSLRTIQVLDALAREGGPTGRPEAEARIIAKSALFAWRDRFDLHGGDRNTLLGVHPCLPVLIDCVDRCTRVFGLRWEGMLLEARPDRRSWGIQIEFAGNPVVQPLFRFCLRRRFASQPGLKKIRLQSEVFRLHRLSRLRVECILWL